ncbi:MBL fold metallo-hydrolase RNA specificity domain-containing protein [Rhodocyclus purpureus]|uniref:MBL fold metallo-hydrolase RNA specificity domain-containing protein n=1 Tax=Rhodocyclus purpureus TaxID=1067 RepID=UPI0019146B34|nr:MBL fold metallo-hydrolase [Rhodocyclus purpureus]MBK5915371.1 MBL fold hydrolase [Rhodocyclus purpureus]
MKISFHGAVGEVTGSCTLVETASLRFLVDCGMFQGGGEAYGKNVAALPFDLRSLDFVILTHAHIDHSGLLPRLSMLGYRGPVYATPASIDLVEVLLQDAAFIQEREAEWQLKRRHRQGSPARALQPPLYTVTQAQASLRQLRPVAYDETFSPAAGVSCRLRDAGHILGSAIAEIWVEEGRTTRKLVFSGDLGQPERPVLNDPTPIDSADLLFVESTYGNRLHRRMDETEDEIVDVFQRTLHQRRGNVIIPAFAVGRTQEILFVFADLVRRGRLPPLTVHVDSPMATRATEITLRHLELLDQPTLDLLDWMRAHPDHMRVEFVADVEESIALNQVRSGAVIISASGMCDAGRVKHHLQYNLSRPECAVLITGFQAAGTLGRRLVDGARMVRLFGEPTPVRAEICTIGGLSAHADQAALLGWLGAFRKPPERTFVMHGEAETATAFARVVREQLGWEGVEAPLYRQSVTVDGP